MAKAITAADVEAVVQGLDQSLPESKRYEILMAALKRQFGQNTHYDPTGLDRVESWTGRKVRGEMV